ncbi:MAG: peptidoglycan -binding protein [Alphaproteobacteria bacterium]|nr:MAG: peptidoglycan -binding protein [Alphaproteobacteria bacterium]
MARGRSTRARFSGTDYWPGFVDALATLLLVLIFLLSIFVLAQFFLSQALSGRDAALAQLDTRLAELSELLNLEKTKTADLSESLAQLSASLVSARDEASLKQAEMDRLTALLSTAEAKSGELATSLAAEQKLSKEAQAEIAALNNQLAALRLQIASLNEALEASEARDKEAQAQIANLGQRLNAALAQKVQELATYRSEFFGRLREVLGDRADIEIVGDRFILQSEVLFDSGSATINPDGQLELLKIARALKEISSEIPPELQWVLRVDGHSDRVPIHTEEFPSNWHLSSARAIAVVTYLTKEGIPPNRLVAAGFGEYHPLTPGTAPADLRRNRRIEFKLTER